MAPMLPTLCNPYFCDGQHETKISPERREWILSSHIQRSMLGNNFNILLTFETEIATTIQELAESIIDPNIHASFNESILLIIQKKMKEFTRHFDFAKNGHLMEHFVLYMAKLGSLFEINVCLHHISETEALRTDEKISSSSLVLCQLQRIRRSNVNQFKWSVKDETSFLQSTTLAIMDLMKNILETSLITKWLKFILKSVSSTRLIQYAWNLRALGSTTTKDGYNVSIDDRALNPFNLSLAFWETATLEGLIASGIRAEDSEEVKEKADDYAVKKEYLKAIEFYEINNFLCLASRNTLVQSLTNSVAIRLRLYHVQPQQAPAAIFEATMALEIDPKHVKALFRRGLALALCKKWNEAIVDFERALELDPNSPAKKELEVARRQVPRRIGN